MFIQSRPQVILAVLAVLADRARYTTRTVEATIQTLSSIAQGFRQGALFPFGFFCQFALRNILIGANGAVRNAVLIT